jgi:hypothetical protein
LSPARSLLSLLLGLLFLWPAMAAGQDGPRVHVINDAKQLEALRGLKHVEGDLRISNLDDLGALGRLVSVGGSLVIAHSGLEDLRAFRNLKSVGGDVFLDAGTIKSLEGIGRLETVGGELEILGSKRFLASSVSGFRKLESVGGDLAIGACKLRGKKVWTVGPFPALVRVGGSLRIANICGNRRRSRRLRVRGFSKLESVGGDVLFRYARQIAPFPSLKEVKGVVEFSGDSVFDQGKIIPSLKRGGGDER